MIDLNKILQQEPTLTVGGLGTNDIPLSTEHISEIETCVEWLNGKEQGKGYNTLSTSYSIKHIIEREQKTYVCNGSFIAAVIHLGLPYRKKQGSRNIYLKIPAKELYKNDPECKKHRWFRG